MNIQEIALTYIATTLGSEILCEAHRAKADLPAKRTLTCNNKSRAESNNGCRLIDRTVAVAAEVLGDQRTKVIDVMLDVVTVEV